MNINEDELALLAGRKFLITGADGMLGRAFQEVLAATMPTASVLAADRAALDVRDRVAVLALAPSHPDFIIHCAASVNADWCERNPEECRRTQVDGTENLIALARISGARMFYPQSVFIFDGRQLPVTESTEPAPTFVYGHCKLMAERLILESCPGALVVRMAGFFGGDEKDKNFVGKFARDLRTMIAAGQRECVVGQRVWQPTYTRDLAGNSLLLLARSCQGIYHMGSRGEASFYEVADAMITELGLERRLRITPGAVALDEPAARPMRMVTATQRLDREGLNRQRTWRESLHDYLQRSYFKDLRVH